MFSCCHTPVSIPRQTDWNMWIYFSSFACVFDKNPFIIFLWNTIFPPHYPCEKYTQNVLRVEGESLSANKIFWILSQVFFPASLPAFIMIVRVIRLFSVFHRLGAYRSIAFPVFKTSSCSDFYSLFIIVFSKGVAVSPVTQSYKANAISVLHKIFTYNDLSKGVKRKKQCLEK